MLATWRLALAVCLTLLAGCEAQHAATPCTLAFATALPLLLRPQQALTPAMLDGMPATLLLDTGSQFTMVTKSTADRMDLDLAAAPGQMTGVGGSRGVFVFSARTFQIGRLQGRNLSLIASDFMISPGTSRADGLLGADFLSAYDVDLDFPAATARLFKAVGDCPSPPVLLDGPLSGVPLVGSGRTLDQRPFVHVRIGGKTLLASVDSGAPHTLIFRNAARAIGLRVEDLVQDQHFRARGLGPDTPVLVRHVMEPITIGDITVANLPVALIDERSPDSTDMLLGMDFLSHVHVWLSFSSHTMIMQYPPKPSPPVAK